MPLPLAAEAAPFIALAGILFVAVIALIVSTVRRRRATVSDAAGSADEPLTPSTPAPLWGLRVPGTPVQRMARTLAIGFIEIDPDETSQLVRSTDGGATWQVVPREQWGERPE